jgi:hypothetical protein
VPEHQFEFDGGAQREYQVATFASIGIDKTRSRRS